MTREGINLSGEGTTNNGNPSETLGKLKTVLHFIDSRLDYIKGYLQPTEKGEGEGERKIAKGFYEILDNERSTLSSLRNLLLLEFPDLSSDKKE